MRFELISNRTLRLMFKDSLYKRNIINVKAQTKTAFQGRNEHFYYKLIFYTVPKYDDVIITGNFVTKSGK